MRFANDKENKNLYLISIGADKSMIFRSYNPFGNLKDENGVNNVSGKIFAVKKRS